MTCARQLLDEGGVADAGSSGNAGSSGLSERASAADSDAWRKAGLRAEGHETLRAHRQ